MLNSENEIAELPERCGIDRTTRRVGVELEFGGLTPERAAGIVGRTTGGQTKKLDSFRFRVEAKEGRYIIELDTRWAHPDFVSNFVSDLPADIRDEVVKGVSQTAGNLLFGIYPVELVCPPIPYDQLGLLRPISIALADAGALGTAHSAFSGFGMHLNVEVVRLDVSHLLSVTRAYLLLSFWLRRESRVSLIRQIQHYIEPFSEAYKRHVLLENYMPNIETFIDDYIRFNPTRNMELDLLPVFAVIDPARVRAALPDIKNSPRPTFHWRLPNCRIDEAEWEPIQDWERWVAVERLASDAPQLVQLSAAYLRDGPASEFEAQLRRFFDLLKQ